MSTSVSHNVLYRRERPIGSAEPLATYRIERIVTPERREKLTARGNGASDSFEGIERSLLRAGGSLDEVLRRFEAALRERGDESNAAVVARTAGLLRETLAKTAELAATQQDVSEAAR